jgi:hypothetical protein
MNAPRNTIALHGSDSMGFIANGAIGRKLSANAYSKLCAAESPTGGNAFRLHLDQQSQINSQHDASRL